MSDRYGPDEDGDQIIAAPALALHRLRECPRNVSATRQNCQLPDGDGENAEKALKQMYIRVGEQILSWR